MTKFFYLHVERAKSKNSRNVPALHLDYIYVYRVFRFIVRHLRIYQSARIICAIAFVGGGGKNQPMDETILSDTVLFAYEECSNFAIAWGNTKLTSQTPLLSKFTRIRRLKAFDSNNIEIIRAKCLEILIR